MTAFLNNISRYFSLMRMPSIHIEVTDVIEVIILSFLVYTVLLWIKNTRAWTLMKGIMVLCFFVALIYIFEMDTLIFLVEKGVNIAIIAAVIIFQPELRRALERIGEKDFFSGFLSGVSGDITERCSDETVREIERAALEMAAVKTGALIVLEQNETLTEYERTGITLNALVSAPLLINIFEHNTPLHDGAVLIKGDTILSATCYLPLSENKTLDKSLGTRHRAGVGISEVTDSLTVIVSEETGKISVARRGVLKKGLSQEALREQLVLWQNKSVAGRKRTDRDGLIRKVSSILKKGAGQDEEK
ncbi:MAG: diadenylate cyclase CdaA [Eubacteriales bacterium]|nr:diadenylate cyclase CdaA [Eubacteriales bacterium]